MKTVILVALLGLGVMDAACAADFSFGRPVHYALLRNVVQNVAIGDANRDGRKDLVFTAQSIFSERAWLSLSLQRSDGSLAPPIELDLPQQAHGSLPVAFIDLDHDGADEIVVGGVHFGLLVFRLEAGSIRSISELGTRRGCKFLATGDVNRDGHPDVACHDAKSTINMFYGDGVGGFSSPSEVASSAGGVGVDDFKTIQIADVTGDGRPDLLVTSGSANSFFVHANNGFGGFWPATTYVHPWAPTGVWPVTLQILDLDGDGVMEVVTASPDNRPGAALNVYRRGANGYLGLDRRIPIHDSTTALVAGDVDGDGDAELVAGHYTFNSVSVMGAHGGGIESQARFDLPGFGNDIIAVPRQGYSNAIALGDLNGDGCVDLAGATHSGITLLPGCRTFVGRIPVIDFDGDGLSDLLWHEQHGSESFLWQSAAVAAWHECLFEMYPLMCPHLFIVADPQAVGDFDGDGNSDVFWRDRGTGANQIWDRALFPRSITGVTNQDWQVVGAGDFDGDDRSDLLWRNARNGANTIWKSANPATKLATSTVSDLRWQVVGVGDFNGDGRSDILWRHATVGRNVIWWSGRPTGYRELKRVSNLSWKVVGVGDFNGDGKDDVVWRNASNGANTIWLSANAATLQAVRGVSNLDWTIAAIGDFNGDYRSDLVWRNVATGANVIWRSGDSRQQQAVERFPPEGFLVH